MHIPFYLNNTIHAYSLYFKTHKDLSAQLSQVISLMRYLVKIYLFTSVI